MLLYRHWKRAAAAESIDAYARRVLVNVFLEDQRGAWARRIAPVAVPVDDVVADASAAADHRLDLTSALARIAPGQRAVLVLRYWERLDVAETAAALGCSPGTVKSQTSLAIAALRRLLPGYATDREPSAPGEGASR